MASSLYWRISSSPLVRLFLYYVFTYLLPSFLPPGSNWFYLLHWIISLIIYKVLYTTWYSYFGLRVRDEFWLIGAIERKRIITKNTCFWRKVGWKNFMKKFIIDRFWIITIQCRIIRDLEIKPVACVRSITILLKIQASCQIQ